MVDAMSAAACLGPARTLEDAASRLYSTRPAHRLIGAKWDQIIGDGGDMRLKKIVEAEDAIAVIHDGDTVASTGYGGNGTPDQLFVALEKRFLETSAPLVLTLVFAGGQGDMKGRGLDHLAHPRLVDA